MIGRRKQTTYADAGVDRGAASRAVESFRDKVRATFRPEVVGDLGHFGGLFAFDPTRYEKPLLVSSTDGVGTKVMVAEATGIHDTVGIDLVAMNVNDIAAMGAEPLFFLDYIVTGKVDEGAIDAIVKGIADGCRQAGCALIGGEIAEHPGHLAEGSYDLAGFCVGVVEGDRIIDGSRIGAGDVVIGLDSSGLHSNGFSLVRKVLLEDMGLRFEDRPKELGCTLAEELLRPTTIYSPLVTALKDEVTVKGLAHVTQGGIPENLGRIIPDGLKATIDRGSWEVPAIFGLIESLGRVPLEEMEDTFNLGIGMVAVVGASDANRTLDAIRTHGFRAREIGAVADRPDGPRVEMKS